MQSAAREAEALHRIPGLWAGALNVSAAETFSAPAMAARERRPVFDTNSQDGPSDHQRLLDQWETMQAHAFLFAGFAHEWATASRRQGLEPAQAVEQQENDFHDRTTT